MDITGRSYICMWDTFSLFVGLSFLFCLFVCFFKCVCFSKMKLPAITTREGHSNISKAEISCSSAAVHATERVRPTIEMQLADNSQQHKELSISVALCKNHCSSSLFFFKMLFIVRKFKGADHRILSSGRMHVPTTL